MVFRTDGGSQVGSGHVMRCLTLAQSLKARGADVLFICREQPGHLGYLITERGFAVQLLAPVPGLATGNWVDDARETRAALEVGLGRKANWLIVDHYLLDRRWEGELRASADRLMVIDDLCNRPHDCDLLLDQNLVADMHERYADKLPASCRQLIGPTYALLHPDYARLHAHVAPRRGAVRRTLVFFGGADSANLTERALDAFLALGRPDIEVDIVIGASSRHGDAVRQKAEAHAHIRVHAGLPSLATLMSRADLAIGAGGSTHWERLCLGLPCLVVTLADNQRPISEELHRLGLIQLLGHHDEVDQSMITGALDRLIRQGLPQEWSLRCMALVDGRGVSRVVTALTLMPETVMQARLATLEDEKLLLEWANDPTTRSNAFSSAPIPADGHARWLRQKLGDLASVRLYIVETADGVALGQVRFECGDIGWEIDYSIAPEFRGYGLGRRLLNTALMRLRADAPGASVFGQVKVDNVPSRKVFESLGFQASESPDVSDGVACYRQTV
ncbi:UDP-2,4-diacetamido-2,4,6-trideoxy-beta-L-altropyranose hydrolase [Rhodoferax saidenbachensis]|uniref:UDP-2,4-diacetamido-2,4, 6-trideoxy-beta-L-altropyranose hydrolase n=1 Tax=Rhodoferax saidenbachensis TaxID=1484693 RepID=UPI001377BD06|nr:UDP-2,4-diacetamido-2,4,6-trideoxy-beta-L-altropyranose hydrolase [Rhodoferax saidenbachensis]